MKQEVKNVNCEFYLPGMIELLVPGYPSYVNHCKTGQMFKTLENRQLEILIIENWVTHKRGPTIKGQLSIHDTYSWNTNTYGVLLK